MIKNIYIIIFIGLIILLTGHYISWITENVFTSRIIILLSFLISGIFLLSFNLKKLPIKKDYPIRPVFLLPIIIGFFGLVIAAYFIPYLVVRLIAGEFTDEFRPPNFATFSIWIVIWVFIEELYFRRILAQMIFNDKGFSKALWLSAFIFSIAHWFTETGLLMAFIGGLALGYIYLKTKSIWLCIFAHLFFNVTTFYLAPEITDRIDEFNSNAKVVGMISFGFILLLSMALLIHFLTKNDFKHREPVGNNI